MSLDLSYGLENRVDEFEALQGRYDQSNSATLRMSIPIWDSGRRRARVQSSMISLQSQEIDMENSLESVRNNVTNTIANVDEFYERALNMQNSVDLARQFTEASILQYENGEITIQDLLQTVARHQETEERFLDIYLSYRQELLDLMGQTYYDYENDMSIFDEFDIRWDG